MSALKASTESRKDITVLLKNAKIVLEHPTEIDLALHLRRFGETFRICC
jgi:hypothetical protein